MREDCTIDRKQVYCPNSTRLGYSKRAAQFGDIVFFNDGQRDRIARMIGRIAFAPNLDGGPHLENLILGACLSVRFSAYSEFWIKPESVTEVYGQEHLEAMRAHVADFLSDSLIDSARKDVTEVRRATSEMWSTIGAYQEWRESIGQAVSNG